MKKTAQTGDKVAIEKFAFQNEYGGTELSNWEHCEKYQGLAIVEITKAWDDCECGWRYHGKPLNPTLIAYLTKVGAIGRPKCGDFTAELERDVDMKIKKEVLDNELVIFFGEFDVDWKLTEQNENFVNYKGE